METDQKILMLMQLNTEEKIDKIVDWVRPRLVDGRLQATPDEVLHATAVIDRTY